MFCLLKKKNIWHCYICKHEEPNTVVENSSTVETTCVAEKSTANVVQNDEDKTSSINGVE